MKNEDKTLGEEIRESLSYKPQSSWLKVDQSEAKEAFDFCEVYKNFLSIVKTEREAVELIENEAKKSEFKAWRSPGGEQSDRFCMVHPEIFYKRIPAHGKISFSCSL